MIRFYGTTYLQKGEMEANSFEADANMTVGEAVDFLKQRKVIYNDTFGFIPIAFEVVE
jgi:hypothetical protein